MTLNEIYKTYVKPVDNISYKNWLLTEREIFKMKYPERIKDISEFDNGDSDEFGKYLNKKYQIKKQGAWLNADGSQKWGDILNKIVSPFVNKELDKKAEEWKTTPPAPEKKILGMKPEIAIPVITAAAMIILYATYRIIKHYRNK